MVGGHDKALYCNLNVMRYIVDSAHYHEFARVSV